LSVSAEPTPQDERIRIQVAFESGQSIGALVEPETADALARAMAGEDRTFDLETEDGIYVLSLAKVVYVRRSSRETQIGFGLAS
jgi:hypothetical protein